MGADLSLDFMTRQLREQDSIFNEDTWAIPMSVDKVFSSYVLARDGTYITHPEHRRILKGNFYDHIKDADVQGLAREAIKYMSAGKKSDNETDKVVLVNRVKTYLFYEPINDTDWILALSVSIMSLDLIGILVGILMVLLIVFMLLVTFFVCRHAIKRVAMPLKQLAATADEVADGQFNTALPTIKSRDEIHLLRDSFENMQHSLATYVEELAVRSAPVRVLRRLLGLRRDSLREAHQPAIRRPSDDRQRYGLLIDLLRFYPLHTLYEEREGSGSLLQQQLVRGLLRVRSRYGSR